MTRAAVCFLMSAVYLAPLVSPEVGFAFGIVLMSFGVGFVMWEAKP